MLVINAAFRLNECRHRRRGAHSLHKLSSRTSSPEAQSDPGMTRETPYRFVATLNAIARLESPTMQVKTIGFTQKSAQRFFTLLNQAEVRAILDVRLNNTSQLAGFSKKPDLEFFLSELLDIKYIELRELTPER